MPKVSRQADRDRERGDEGPYIMIIKLSTQLLMINNNRTNLNHAGHGTLALLAVFCCF